MALELSHKSLLPSGSPVVAPSCFCLELSVSLGLASVALTQNFREVFVQGFLSPDMLAEGG